MEPEVGPLQDITLPGGYDDIPPALLDSDPAAWPAPPPLPMPSLQPAAALLPGAEAAPPVIDLAWYNGHESDEDGADEDESDGDWEPDNNWEY